MFKAYKKLLEKGQGNFILFTIANFLEVLVNDDQAILE
jgi:hypothetical protein